MSFWQNLGEFFEKNGWVFEKEGVFLVWVFFEMLKKKAFSYPIDPHTLPLQIEFRVSVLGTPKPKVQWYKDDSEVFACDRIEIKEESEGGAIAVKVKKNM